MANRVNKSSLNPMLRAELLQMQDEDQKMRKRAAETNMTSAWHNNVDRRYTERMKEIIKEFGWPGKSLVGQDGASAAWLLVQHADHDRDFQKKCLVLLEKAVTNGEAELWHLAYLVDRLRVAEGQPQLYGTQFFMDEEGNWKLCPIEEENNVDNRRASMGLTPLSEYVEKALPWMQEHRQIKKSK